MTYNVTCTCGHQFALTDDQLGRIVACPSCSRALTPVPAEPVSAAPVDDADPRQPVKACPHCGETILAVARKCRFCHEYLDRAATPAAGAAAASVVGGATTAADPAAANNEPVFSLCVSQWDNFFRYLICTLIVVGSGVGLYFLSRYPAVKDYAGLAFACIFGVVALTAYFFYAGARSVRYIIRPSRLEMESGIFSKKTDQIELFRIMDLELKQNLLLRLLGIGTIVLKTTDETSPDFELYLIPQARKVYKYLQDQIPKADKARGAIHVQR